MCRGITHIVTKGPRSPSIQTSSLPTSHRSCDGYDVDCASHTLSAFTKGPLGAKHTAEDEAFKARGCDGLVAFHRDRHINIRGWGRVGRYSKSKLWPLVRGCLHQPPGPSPGPDEDLPSINTQTKFKSHQHSPAGIPSFHSPTHTQNEHLIQILIYTLFLTWRLYNF